MSSRSHTSKRREPDEGREDLTRRLRRGVVIGLLLLAGIAGYQILRLEVEVSSAEINFKNLILEYHTAGETSFRQHLATALRADRFFIQPEDVLIVVDPRGTVRFALKHTRRFRILVFPMSRDVRFESETLFTAS